MRKAIFWFFLAALGILALAKGIDIPSSVDTWDADSIKKIDSLWERYLVEDQEVLEYRYTIDQDAEHDMWLCMKTYLEEFQIYLNEERIYDFSDAYGIKGGSQHIIRLPADAPGQTMIIRILNANTRTKDLEIRACLGRESRIWMKLLRENLYAAFFGIFMFFLGVASLVFAVFFRKNTSKEIGKGLGCLGGFIFTAGIWVVTDSELLLFVTDRTALVSLMSFTSFMVMPAFLLNFINHMLERRKSLVFLCRMFSFIAVVYLLDFLYPVIPSFVFLFPVHCGCVAGMGIVLQTGLKKQKERKSPEVLKIMQGFALLSIFSVAAFVQFYRDSTSQYAVLYCIGICLFCLCLLISVFMRIWEQIEQNASMLAYKHLAYTDTMTGLLNRTAYMEEEQKPLEEGCAYIILDINNLKQINDRFGHRSGDRLIITAAEYIKKCFGETGKCYRIGGDEFLVICRKCSKEQAAAAIEEMYRQIKNENAAKEVGLQMAAGYAVQQENDTSETLFQRADNCMYENKEKMKKVYA